MKKGVEDETLAISNFVPVSNGADFDRKVLSFGYLKACKVSEIAGYFGNSNST